MLFGISALLKMLAWFAAFSAVAGLAAAACISRRPGTQRLFGDVEDLPMKVEHARPPIAGWPVWTLSAALTLGILIGYLLGQILAVLAHAQSLAHATMSA